MSKLNKDTLLNYYKGNADYSAGDTSYSPFYSNIGLEIHDNAPGITKLWLHYNRFSRVLWNVFAEFGGVIDKKASSPEKLVFTNGNKLSFFGTDAFMLFADDGQDVRLFTEKSDALTESWVQEATENTVLLRGYSANGDARDPDEAVPFLLGIRAVNGKLTVTDNGITAAPENGKLLLAFVFEALTPEESSVKQKLLSAPKTVEACAHASLNVIKNTVKELDITCPPGQAAAAARAINGLTENLAKAPGALSKHLSSYPSRGYSSHFLWDTCFQNLAYEEINTELAEDFLLQFKENQRPDGKYPQFLCSTWARPGYTQPALLGWATERVYRKTGNIVFLKTMLPSLDKNNSWWLNNRMTASGVIRCAHGLETGQDDSPRFDNGATLACDMNAYLLSQLRLTAALHEELGEANEAAHWSKKANALSDAMLRVLYCAEDNLFYDVTPNGTSFIKIVSPVSLLPLWAGVSLPEAEARSMIERYLLSPDYLFGDIPFPSVAYNEPTYDAAHWWRGPTWMSEAWLMLETLQKFGYQKEYAEAADRLFRMLLADGGMHELFNSRTGEGMGYEQQGWTCATYLALLKQRSEIFAKQM